MSEAGSEIVHDGGGDAGIRIAAGPRPVQSPQPGGPQAPIVHEPKFELEGKKWAIEHQRNKHDMVVEHDDMLQSVSILKCEDCSVVLKNKVNSVVIDNCKKCIIVLSSVISSVVVIRCDRLKIQCQKQVPYLRIDSSERVEITHDLETVPSKSAADNVCLFEPVTKEVHPEVFKEVSRTGCLLDKKVKKWEMGQEDGDLSTKGARSPRRKSLQTSPRRSPRRKSLQVTKDIVHHEVFKEKTPQKNKVHAANEEGSKEDLIMEPIPKHLKLTPPLQPFLGGKTIKSNEIKGDQTKEGESSKNPQPIPPWATGVRLRNAVVFQESNPTDVENLFGNLIPSPNLEEMMGVSNDAYQNRTSSATWTTP